MATTGKRLGIGMHSYGQQWAAGRRDPANALFHDALTFLDYAHRLGAGGVQVSLGDCAGEPARLLRRRCDEWGMYLEAQTSMPDTDADLPRFEREVRAAAEAGVTLFRTALLSGRRYETFRTAADFEGHVRNARARLTRAEPVLRSHRMRLAVENHKDWRARELIDFLKGIGSEWIGVTLDTGNNVALLEDPLEVVETLAPFAWTTHIKDMGLEPCPEGFLLSEVPLGQGFLDLPKILAICSAAAPQIQFNLEMITRDPLTIPFLKPGYWATFGPLPARDLALIEARVQSQRERPPLPRLSGLPTQAQRDAEDQNVRRSLEFAQAKLGLA